MYIITRGNDRPQQIGLRGFSAPPLSCADKTGKDAIQCALQLNPAGGYVKGSKARRILDAAFNSVPPSFALELAQQLEKGKDTLGKLFRYRLADPTQRTMLETLKIIGAEYILKLKNEADSRAKEAAEADRQKTCARWKAEDMETKSVCEGVFIGKGRGYFKPADPVMCEMRKVRVKIDRMLKKAHCP